MLGILTLIKSVYDVLIVLVACGIIEGPAGTIIVIVGLFHSVFTVIWYVWTFIICRDDFIRLIKRK